MTQNCTELPPPLFADHDLRGRLPTRLDGVAYRTRPLERVIGVAIHATAWEQTTESLALYQTTKLEGDPYPAIAYHFVVATDGAVDWCHDLATETWHAGAEGSYRYAAVCLVGAAAEGGPSDVQVAAVRALLGRLERELGRTLEVQPHHELLRGARCLGDGWERWGHRLRAEVPA